MKLNCAERNTHLLRARLFNFRGSQGISVWVMNGGKEEYRKYIVSVKGRSSSIWALCQETKLRTPGSSLLGTRDVFFSAWSNSPVSYIDKYWVTCQLFNQSLQPGKCHEIHWLSPAFLSPSLPREKDALSLIWSEDQGRSP